MQHVDLRTQGREAQRVRPSEEDQVSWKDYAPRAMDSKLKVALTGALQMPEVSCPAPPSPSEKIYPNSLYSERGSPCATGPPPTPDNQTQLIGLEVDT